jgi:hypothetical protein
MGGWIVCSTSQYSTNLVSLSFCRHPITCSNKPVTHPPFHVPTPHKGDSPPITWSAFEYDYAYDTTQDSYQGNCHDYDRDDGVDGMYTSVSL